MASISTNWSQYDQISALFDVRQETPQEKIKSYFGEPHIVSECAKDCLHRFSSMIRIDRRVADVCKNPSLINGYKLFYSLFVGTIALTTFKVAGIGYAVLVVVTASFSRSFSGGWGTVVRHHEDLIRRMDVEYYPQNTMLRNIGIGLYYTPLINVLRNIPSLVVELLLRAFKLPLDAKQDVARLLTGSGIESALMMAYVCVIAPIFEEYTFRGVLTDGILLKNDDQLVGRASLKPSHLSFFQKIKRAFIQSDVLEAKARTMTDLKKEGKGSRSIFKTAMISAFFFGLMHLTLGLGWMNPVIFVSTAVAGFCFSYLTEYTGDLWASTSAHILSNLLFVLSLRGIL